MTKFGKFKLRLLLSIKFSTILAIINVISASNGYWIKYVDHESNGVPHYAGLFRSCPVGQQSTTSCQWKNGIINSTHSLWSIGVRGLLAIGTFANIAAVFALCFAYYFKINKKSKCAIKLMEWANVLLLGAFVAIFAGFTVLISTKWSFSLWFHVAGLCLLAISSNLTTRLFARLYYMNTRGAKSSSRTTGVEAGCCTAEEKIALAQVADKETNTANGSATVATATEPQMSPIESSKVNEQNGSNEALLPAQQTASVQPSGAAVETTTETA